jgi:hypothetical protein
LFLPDIFGKLTCAAFILKLLGRKQMRNKRFSERLNKELDNIGAPESSIERIEVLSKLVKIPKFKAESLLNGTTNPDERLLNTLAQEFEVSADWLVGKDDAAH